MDKHEIIIEEGILQIKKYGAVFPIDELCAKLSISKKTLYSHFPTKNDLIKKILDRVIEKWRSECCQNMTSQTDAKGAYLEIFLYHFEEITTFNTNFFGSLKLKFPKEFLIIDAYFSEVRTQLLEVLREGQKNKQIKHDYNLEMFLEKETAFFEHLFSKHHVITFKEDYIKLLNLSIEGLLAK